MSDQEKSSERAQNHRALVEDALIAHCSQNPHLRAKTTSELEFMDRADHDERKALQKVDVLADLHDIELASFTEDGRYGTIIVKFRGLKNGEPTDYIYKTPTSLNTIIMNYVLGSK